MLMDIAVLRIYARVAGAALLLFFAFSPSAVAQDTRLGDVSRYLMPRGEEVSLARSAAPGGIGEHASVWLLTRNGYEEVERGTNGFVCFVGRGWSGPIMVGVAPHRRLHPDVFDPRLRAPHCFNPLAATALMPWHNARTAYLIAGVAAEQVDGRVAEDLAAGRLRAPEPGAMAYMMSAHQDLGPNIGSWRPHVMVYLSHLTNADWGIVGFTHEFPFVAEGGTPWSVAVMPMRTFSDGSRAADAVAGRKK
jgi:hypothetical protein